MLASMLLSLAYAGTMPAAVPSSPRLVAHEWGTFTTVVSPTGTPVAWRPLLGDQDLPDFVYEPAPNPDEPDRPLISKDGIHALVRMETPVVYFYADVDEPMPVELSVGYTSGYLTEWFPRADVVGGPGGQLRWRVDLLPRDAEVALANDGSDSHYYAARAVDANIVVDQATGEADRLLFYRGVGNAKPAITLQERSPGKLSVYATGAPRGTALIVTADAESLCWQEVAVRVGVSRPGRETCGEQQVLEGQITALLEEAGLYAAEAEAMVATWEGHWFEPGTRLMSIVPRSQTDQLLPMQISPAPDALERVMVERTELLPQDSLERLVAVVSDGGGRAEAEAIFGRFADAAVIMAHESGLLTLEQRQRLQAVE